MSGNKKEGSRKPGTGKKRRHSDTASEIHDKNFDIYDTIRRFSPIADFEREQTSPEEKTPEKEKEEGWSTTRLEAWAKEVSEGRRMAQKRRRIFKELKVSQDAFAEGLLSLMKTRNLMSEDLAMLSRQFASITAATKKFEKLSVQDEMYMGEDEIVDDENENVLEMRERVRKEIGDRLKYMPGTSPQGKSRLGLTITCASEELFLQVFNLTSEMQTSSRWYRPALEDFEKVLSTIPGFHEKFIVEKGGHKLVFTGPTVGLDWQKSTDDKTAGRINIRGTYGTLESRDGQEPTTPEAKDIKTPQSKSGTRSTVKKTTKTNTKAYIEKTPANEKEDEMEEAADKVKVAEGKLDAEKDEIEEKEKDAKESEDVMKPTGSAQAGEEITDTKVGDVTESEKVQEK